ncbi:MAG TPA: dihydrolipoamide acetyltransferase family protein, partial [Solirubrobacterales bacterium]
MAAEIVMPRLSDSMEEGTVLRWLKSEGEEVAVGDELVEIETDKANMVYESDAAGTLIEIVANEGDTLGIGEVIARVGDASEANGAGKKKKGKDRKAAGNGGKPEAEASPASTATAAPAAETGAPSVTQSEGDGRVKASPIARRIAAEKGVDLGALRGSGPGGRIVKADVEGAEAKPAAGPAPAAAALERPETAKGEVSQQELTKLQQTVARRMAESKATAPHFYLSVEIDMTRAVEARSRMKAGTPEGEPVPSFNDMVVKACAIALREHPRANGAYRDGRLELYSRINVGVAVAAQDALTVPTIFDADRKGLREIARQTRELAGKVRDATVTPPELSGGT